MTLAIRMTLLAGLVSIFIVSFLSVQIHAQNLTGEIDGVVRDSSGAVVPNASVTVKNTAQNLVERRVTCDGQGQFTAPLLPIGSYSVTVEAPGFQTSTVSGIEVHLNQPASTAVVLFPGKTAQTVTVTANPVAPQLETAAAGTLINGTQLRQLSLSSRNYQQLLSLQPGITGVVPGTIDRGIITAGGASNAANFSVNGQRVSQNGYFLDGVDMVGHGASQQSQFFPSIDSIQEMSLLRNTFGAQYGGEGSAIITMTTRSGTNTFHGGAYEFFRSQVLNANNYFNNLAHVARPGIRYNDFGYQVGGPLWIPHLTNRQSSRTFFFLGQEFLREETQSSETLTNIPTAAQRRGIFNAAVCTQYNANGTCAASATSISQVDPTAQAYLKDIINKTPLPNSPTDPQGLIASETGFNNETQSFVRVDHKFSDRLTAFFRYIHEPFHLVVPNGLYSGTGIPGVGTSALSNGSTNYLGHVTFVASPKTVIEGAYSQAFPYNRAIPTGLISSAASPDIKPNLPFVSTLAQVPNLNINGSTYTATGPYFNPGTYLLMFVNVTHTLGRHTLRMGFNFEDLHLGGNAGGNNTGNFTFSAGALPAGSTATQFDQSFADFLEGNVAAFTQLSKDAVAWVHGNLYEAYIQDDFHASPRLTLNAGVRYTFVGQPSNERYKNYPRFLMSNFDPALFNPANAPTIGTNGLICTAAPCPGGAAPNPNYNPLNGVISGGVNSPYGNAVNSQPNLTFAPRVGFAWDVRGNGRTALRGGYGIYYAQTLYGNYQNMVFQNVPNVQNTTINNTSFGNPGNGIPVASAAPLVLYGTTPDTSIPYVQDFSLDLQQELASNTVLDIGYYGNHSLHQLGELDLNQPLAGEYVQKGIIPSAPGKPPVVTTANTSLLNQIRPYPGWGPINVLAPIFIGNYNSLQASLTQRFSGGSLLNLDYTWSRAMTNSQADRSVPPANIHNIRAEYGPALYNRTNVFSANFVYMLPFFHAQQGIVGHVLGGWEATGIISYGSGLPVTPATINVDPGGLGLLAAGLAGSAKRPDQVEDPNSSAPHTPKKWFNTAAFTQVPIGQYRPGNASVGSIIGPGYETWDLSAFKNVKIKDSLSTQFRFESFNAFNHTNFIGVASTLGQSNYGQITSAGSARVLQLGAKITF